MVSIYWRADSRVHKWTSQSQIIKQFQNQTNIFLKTVCRISDCVWKQNRASISRHQREPWCCYPFYGRRNLFFEWLRQPCALWSKVWMSQLNSFDVRVVFPIGCDIFGVHLMQQTSAHLRTWGAALQFYSLQKVRLSGSTLEHLSTKWCWMRSSLEVST